MNSHPKLIRSRGFTIESVTHQKDVEGSFRVSLQLSKRERGKQTARLISQSNGKLMRGDDPRLTKR